MAYKKSSYQILSKKNFTMRGGRAYFSLDSSRNVEEYIESIKTDGYIRLIINHHQIWTKLEGGIYIFSIKNKATNKVDTAYVGSSRSLKTRLNGHQVARLLIYGICDTFEVTLHIIPTEHYVKLEKDAIRKLNPFLNSDYCPHKNSGVIQYSLPKRISFRGKKGLKLGHII